MPTGVCCENCTRQHIISNGSPSSNIIGMWAESSKYCKRCGKLLDDPISLGRIKKQRRPNKSSTIQPLGICRAFRRVYGLLIEY